MQLDLTTTKDEVNVSYFFFVVTSCWLLCCLVVIVIFAVIVALLLALLWLVVTLGQMMFNLYPNTKLNKVVIITDAAEQHQHQGRCCSSSLESLAPRAALCELVWAPLPHGALQSCQKFLDASNYSIFYFFCATFFKLFNSYITKILLVVGHVHMLCHFAFILSKKKLQLTQKLK